MNEELAKRIVDAYDRAVKELDRLQRENGLLTRENSRLKGNIEALRRNFSEGLSRPISELQLSLRGRKCMTQLGITTVGELIARTAADLLKSKNFGITCLNELREKLAKQGLCLTGEDSA